MATKKPSLRSKPSTKKNLDAFVEGNITKTAEEPEQEQEPNKRLTIDIPQSLHTRLKLHAVKEGTKMNVLLRQWIEQELDQHGA